MHCLQTSNIKIQTQISLQAGNYDNKFSGVGYKVKLVHHSSLLCGKQLTG